MNTSNYPGLETSRAKSIVGETKTSYQRLDSSIRRSGFRLIKSFDLAPNKLLLYQTKYEREYPSKTLDHVVDTRKRNLEDYHLTISGVVS